MSKHTLKSILRDICYIIVLLLLAAFVLSPILTSCSGQKEPVYTIEGRWEAMLPAHPNWVYDFHNGLLTQTVSDFGAVISQRQYPYTVRYSSSPIDTLFVGGDTHEPARTWLLDFECATIVHLQAIGTPFNGLQYLRRVGQ